jgi:hypothetical protein
MQKRKKHNITVQHAQLHLVGQVQRFGYSAQTLQFKTCSHIWAQATNNEDVRVFVLILYFTSVSGDDYLRLPLHTALPWVSILLIKTT